MQIGSYSLEKRTQKRLISKADSAGKSDVHLLARDNPKKLKAKTECDGIYRYLNKSRSHG